MTPASPQVVDALAPLGAMLKADGYALEIGEEVAGALVAEIRAGPDACADCLVPRELMQTYFEKALQGVFELGLPQIRLVYPSDGSAD
jgi:hypothetical protein